MGTKPDMNECIKGRRSMTDCTMGSCNAGKCQCFRGFVLHPNNARLCIRGDCTVRGGQCGTNGDCRGETLPTRGGVCVCKPGFIKDPTDLSSTKCIKGDCILDTDCRGPNPTCRNKECQCRFGSRNGDESVKDTTRLDTCLPGVCTKRSQCQNGDCMITGAIAAGTIPAANTQCVTATNRCRQCVTNANCAAGT